MKLKCRGAFIQIKKGRKDKYPIQRLNLGLYLITAGLTAFYICRIYFITFEGNFRANSFKESFFVSGVTTSKELDRKGKRPIPLFVDNKINMERDDVFAEATKITRLEKRRLDYNLQKIASQPPQE